MKKIKKLLLLLLLCGTTFCFCPEAVGQNVEVSLKVDAYSPFIAKYTKEQMTKKLLDTVIHSCHSKFLKLGRDITFDARSTVKPKSNAPGYKLELKVIDSTYSNDKYGKVHCVIAHSKFYEEGAASDNIRSGTMLVSYSPGISSDVESNAIDAYFSCARIEAGLTVEYSLPLSLTESIAARNLFAKDELDRFESFKEMVIRIEYEKIDGTRKEDIDRLIMMINNIFFSQQGRVSNKRSLDGGRSQFNYYFTTDSIGYSGPTVSGNPVELKLIIESIGPSGYQIRLEFDEQKYSFKNYFGVSKKDRSVLVPAETLRKMPSRINNDLTNLIETFVNSNLR